MVITEQIDNGYRLSLMPNSSISWQGSLLFLALISFPITIIGITFFFYGAPIILPFAGLEILIVGTALYVVFKKSSKKEVITLTKEKLTIEKGRFRPDSVSNSSGNGHMFLLKNLLTIGIQLKLSYLPREKNSCREFFN